MNPFIQHIGIWYDTIENRNKVYEIMLSWFQNSGVLYRTICNRNEASFYFNGGDWIRFLPYSESMRGARLTDSYLVNPIEHLDIINNVVLPKTIFDGGVYVIDISELSSEKLYNEFRNKRKMEELCERIFIK